MAVMEDVKTTEDVDLVELMNTRARSYGMLARLFREEVDLATLRELQGMRFPRPRAMPPWTRAIISCTIT